MNTKPVNNFSEICNDDIISLDDFEKVDKQGNFSIWMNPLNTEKKLRKCGMRMDYDKYGRQIANPITTIFFIFYNEDQEQKYYEHLQRMRERQAELGIPNRVTDNENDPKTTNKIQ